MKQAHVLIPPGSTLAPGATLSGTLDLRGATDALLSAKVSNAAAGPTAGTRLDVYVAHDSGDAPAAWSLLQTWTAGVTNGERYEFARELPRAAMHARIVAWGCAGRAVTVEALASVLTG